MANVSLTRLTGGPQDGKVAPTGGTVPAFLLGQPTNPTLLDEPDKEAVWNPECQWYEVVEDA